ncbi:MAG: magnesium transporter [Vicinamibacteraceae bacterium]
MVVGTADDGRPRRVPIVLLTSALVSFLSVWRATALAVTELALGLFFVMGVSGSRVGAWTLPAMVGGAALAVWLRRLDIESWTLLIPGGLPGRVERAFGDRASRVASAAVLGERLFLAALASLVAGDYLASLLASAFGGWALSTQLTTQDLATLVAVAVIGTLWLSLRLGRALGPARVATGVWVGVGVLGVVAAWVVTSLFLAGSARLSAAVALPVPAASAFGRDGASSLLAALLACGLALPAIGAGDALTRLAHEFPAPRVGALRRTSLIVAAIHGVGLVAFTLGYLVLIPIAERPMWTDIPLLGIVQHVTGPQAPRPFLQLALVAAAMLLLVPAVQSALGDAEQLLRRLATAGILPSALTRPHRRLGTLTRSIDAVAALSVGIVVASAGRVGWMAGGYAAAVAFTLVLRCLTLARLRRTLPKAPALSVPRGQEGMSRRGTTALVLLAAGVTLVSVAMLAHGDGAWLASTALLVVLVLALLRPRRALEDDEAAEAQGFELLASSAIALQEAQAQPGNLLVAVRHPHALDHVAAALQSAADREVVVVTVRLRGTDADGASTDGSTPLPAERLLFARVITLVERYARPVRLLVVSAPTVADGLATAVVQLRSAAVYVGESATLSAADQARLLGEAWERTAKPGDLDVRLVIHHRSGRTDSYQLGAHVPALSSADLDLIHRVWRDAVRTIGPHVHHHDVVRAALTHMEEQLNSSDRADVMARIRATAQPAEELTAVIRARDFTQLRDMVRNRPPNDVAEVLTALGVEDQVVAFRVLPRKDAAAVFEYLSHDSQEALLKAMAQEDVAALLNEMAPDDRTMFLEELPAAATRQLLALLTAEERAVAVNLLGYPDGSIGRLMTPDYVAVREHWTVREVLEYVRTHGRDSETLNVLYVVDDHHALVDDIRIREFLLTDPERQVSELMDRRFVALKATDDQDTAVAAFRQHDRTALPVTDTAGVLIGIVTIDDVLDVAEATATREIHRIGGSEALDEPYMRIAFGKMIRKRAGWLTALFLGEMLTATAMGAFEEEIAKAVVLALFVPLIISSGGNSGSQASTLVIRALALGELRLSDWWRVMRRELLAGLALGTILGSIGFLRITVWSGFSDIYGPHWLLVAITVALALVGIVLWGTLIGSLLPFLLRRLGFDPATSSAPFVATLVDVTGLVLYFSVAMVILRGTLL